MTTDSAPQHDDYNILLALIASLDKEGTESESDLGLDELVAHYVDPASIAFLAIQQVMRSMHITSVDETNDRADELLSRSLLYHEAFIMGCRFQQFKDKP